ncbi:MAG: hypothetical protein AAGK00_15780 [Pseudomonadota bacterium]
MFTEDETVNSMRKLMQDMHEQLMRFPQYRAMKALEVAISEIEAVNEPVEVTDARDKMAFSAYKALSVQRRKATALSQADAVERVLQKIGRPMKAVDLVPLVTEQGASLKGKDPSNNLASNLSRDPRFRSIRFGGVPCWWFADQAVPDWIQEDGEQLFSDDNEAREPNANQHSLAPSSG